VKALGLSWIGATAPTTVGTNLKNQVQALLEMCAYTALDSMDQEGMLVC